MHIYPYLFIFICTAECGLQHIWISKKVRFPSFQPVLEKRIMAFYGKRSHFCQIYQFTEISWKDGYRKYYCRLIWWIKTYLAISNLFFHILHVLQVYGWFKTQCCLFLKSVLFLVTMFEVLLQKNEHTDIPFFFPQFTSEMNILSI